MAVTMASDLQPVASVTSRLRAVLDQAAATHTEDASTNALPIDALLPEIDALHDDIPNHYDQAYKYSVVECAARELFYAWVGTSALDDPAFANVWNLLDVLMHAGDREICVPELVCLLIEELMDSLTTTDCRTVMDYLESRREALARKDFHKKNLVLLRACNELLRRLSRAEDAVFCGRVFFFLFMAFPLGDRSSVNLRGEFHTENTTKFEVSETTSQQDGDKMDVDVAVKTSEPEAETQKTATPPPPAGKPGSRAVPIKPPPKKEPEPVLSNSELYPIFWRLQQDFSDPTRLFAPAELQRFKTSVDSTVAKFKRTPTVQTTAAEESKRGTKRKLGASAVENGTEKTTVDNYNPKYLTSRELFDLELSDLAFQRHVLVQTLILIDFLQSLTEKARKKSEMATASNKALGFKDFILSDKDAAWAATTSATINSYLTESSDEGRLFQRMVETVLARDKNWVRWKLDGCPSIVKEPASTQSEMEARDQATKVTRPRKVPVRPNGAMKLFFLDESSGTGLEVLKDPKRYTISTSDELIDGMETDELDMEMAMGDAEIAGLQNTMANKRWRLLRQARSNRLALLDKVEPGKGQKADDLKAVFKPPPEDEGPAAGTEAAEDAPSADEGMNGGPSVLVTAEADEGPADSTNDVADGQEAPSEPAHTS